MAKAEGGRPKMNAVEQNATWREAIKRENRQRSLNENFAINPKNLVILSDKPMHVKQQRNDEELKEELGELKTKLDALSAVPKTKYAFP